MEKINLSPDQNQSDSVGDVGERESEVNKLVSELEEKLKEAEKLMDLVMPMDRKEEDVIHEQRGNAIFKAEQLFERLRDMLRVSGTNEIYSVKDEKIKQLGKRASGLHARYYGVI